MIKLLLKRKEDREVYVSYFPIEDREFSFVAKIVQIPANELKNLTKAENHVIIKPSFDERDIPILHEVVSHNIMIANYIIIKEVSVKHE